MKQTSSYESLTFDLPPPRSVVAAEKPNVIPSFMDNFVYGGLGCYGGGINRGAPTPRFDKLAVEGLRPTNCNVFPTREN